MITPENSHVDYDLLAKYFAGETSTSESEEVEGWIGESDDNWAEFQRLNKVWEKANKSEQPEFASDKAWKKIDSRLEIEKRPSNFRKFPLLIAAALIGLVAVSLVYKSFLAGDYVEQMVLETTSETKELTLSDGSIVFLNEASNLEYPSIFRGDERVVSLSGEAFFEISKDPAKPFIINANGSVVKVLGTSFNVQAERNTVVVSVETGKVEFRSEVDVEQKNEMTGMVIKYHSNLDLAQFALLGFVSAPNAHTTNITRPTTGIRVMRCEISQSETETVLLFSIVE